MLALSDMTNQSVWMKMDWVGQLGRIARIAECGEVLKWENKN